MSDAAAPPIARFGVVTDLHFARRPDHETRHYAGSLDKLSVFIETLHRARIDTLFVLGDLIDHPDEPATERALLAEVRETLNRFDGAWHALPGNHDLETMDKRTFRDTLGCTLPPWRVDLGAIAVLGIDGTFTPDGKPYTPGSFHWDQAMFAGGQLDWLRSALAALDRPAVVVSHQQLAGTDPRHVAANSGEVLAMLAESGKVIGCLAGHDHHGTTVESHGLRCFTIRATVEATTPRDHAGAIVTVDRDGEISIG